MSEVEFETWCRREFNDPNFWLSKLKLEDGKKGITSRYNENRKRYYERKKLRNEMNKEEEKDN